SQMPEGARSEAYVVLGTAGSEAGVDGLDAYALTPPAQAYVQVASLAASGEGEMLALSVDHRPGMTGTTEIPLTVSAVGVEGATRLVLTWPGLDTLPEGTSVRLVDRETGAEIDLATATEYAFEVTPEASGAGKRDLLAPPAPTVQRAPEAALTGGLRFTLVIARGASTGTESGAAETLVSRVMPNPTRGRAAVRLSVGTPQRVRATVHDALGREVALAFDAEVTAAAEIAVETRGLASGVYAVRIEGETFAETRRLTVAR
ncbi:MAG: T9SS type A sorting domain-containing protein, partial [Bacteroidota bacterium]